MNEKVIASIDILQTKQQRLATSLAYKNKLQDLTEEKQKKSKDTFVDRLSMLKKPISKWKYIGMVNYEASVRGANIDFVLLSELRLVIVTGLDLVKFYEKLESEIVRRTNAQLLEQSKDDTSTERRAKLESIKVPGSTILEILEES